MAKCDRRRIAAVFAANADFEVGPDAAALVRADPHQLADAVLVDRHKWIDLEAPLLEHPAVEIPFPQ